MKRRRILRLTAYVAGGALVMPVAGTLLGSCNEVEVDLDAFKPAFFKSDEFHFIREMADALLPSGDTPGASDVGVPEMFDIMVNNVLDADQQNKYRTRLGKLMTYIKTQKETSGATEISELIGNVDSALRGESSADKEVNEAYADLRGRTLQYYTGSEVVGTTLLNYLPVPGQYEPCIDLAEVNGKAWSL